MALKLAVAEVSAVYVDGEIEPKKAIIKEVNDNQIIDKLRIEEVTSLSQLSKDWANSIPYGSHEDLTIKEILEPQSESLKSQIDRLARFILEEIPGEPSQDQGAVDAAIRIMKQQREALKMWTASLPAKPVVFDPSILVQK